ncbi:hypothetical protein [Polymorphobacter sp. PAMC 29334]|nr:hypothetical protein [Polymorphobacter sp. PAMC 29334]
MQDDRKLFAAVPRDYMNGVVDAGFGCSSDRSLAVVAHLMTESVV